MKNAIIGLIIILLGARCLVLFLDLRKHRMQQPQPAQPVIIEPTPPAPEPEPESTRFTGAGNCSGGAGTGAVDGT